MRWDTFRNDDKPVTLYGLFEFWLQFWNSPSNIVKDDNKLVTDLGQNSGSDLPSVKGKNRRLIQVRGSVSEGNNSKVWEPVIHPRSQRGPGP